MSGKFVRLFRRTYSIILVVIAARLVVTATARVGCRCRIWRWVWRRIRSWRRVRCGRWCRRWCRGVAAAGLAVAGREVEVAEHLPGLLRLAIDGLRLGQVEQAVQYAQRRGHVLVLQRILPLQVVAGKVLAAEALERRVLGLACLMHPADSLDQHLVLRLKVSQAVANLLRHTVVVLSVASLDESGRAERAFDRRDR